MPKLFEIGSVVVENEPSKNIRKSKNPQKSIKFCQEFHWKSPKCVQNQENFENFKFYIPDFSKFPMDYDNDFW